MMDGEKLDKIIAKIRFESGLIKDRTYNFKTYKRVIVGQELVSYLVERSFVISREQAIEFGQNLIEKNIIHHVYDDHKFKDGLHIHNYFTPQINCIIVSEFSDESENANNAAVIKSKDATLKGVLAKKGKMKWNNRYVVLRTDEAILYVYDDELASTPRHSIDVRTAKLDVNDCGDCRKGYYCFNIISENRIHTLCSTDAKEQEIWLQLLVDLGACWLDENIKDAITETSIFDFTVLDIDKKEVSLKEYAGKVCLIVNVASECSLTNIMYPQLQEVYEKYKSKGLEILAFPSSQFGRQEPGNNEQIKKFVSEKFNISFQMFDKVLVNGKDAIPLFKFLKAQAVGTLGSAIKWNFTKFLCNKQGKPVKRFSPHSRPQLFESEIASLLEQTDLKTSTRYNPTGH